MGQKISQVDTYISGISDWRGKMLAELRELIHQADPNITEEWKWDVPIFVDQKMICAISAFAAHVKINFFKGAKLNDPHKVFNNGLESKKHRSIDFSEGDKLPANAIKEFVRQAIALNK